MLKKIFVIVSALFITTTASAQCIWTDNPNGPGCSIIPQAGNLTLGNAGRPFGNIYGTFVGTITSPTISGNLTFSTAAAKIIPGATSLTFRNNADSASNLSITDAGLVTVGVGNLALTAGNLVFGAAAAKVIPGATSLTFRNNADSASNLSIADSGALTIRGSINASGVTTYFNLIGGPNGVSVRDTANAADNLVILDAGAVSIRSTFRSSATSDLGWSVVNAANQACNTTCTSACVVGLNTAAVGNFLACTDATADTCLCAGAS